MKALSVALGSLALVLVAACSEADRQNIKDALTPPQDVEVSEENLNSVGCGYQVTENAEGESTTDFGLLSCEDEGVETLATLQSRSEALNTYLAEIAAGLETHKISDDSKELLLKKQAAANKLKVGMDAKLAVRSQEYFNYEAEYSESVKGRLVDLAEVVLDEANGCYIDFNTVYCDSVEKPVEISRLLTNLRNFQKAHALFAEPNTDLINSVSRAIKDIVSRQASYDGYGAAWGEKRSDLLRNIVMMKIKSNSVSYMGFNGILSPDPSLYETPAEILHRQRERLAIYRESFEVFRSFEKQIQLDMLLAGVLAYDAYSLNGVGFESGAISMRAGLSEIYANDIGHYLVETMKYLEKLHTDFADELKISTHRGVGEMLEAGVDAIRIIDQSYEENGQNYLLYQTPYYDYSNGRLTQMRQVMLQNNCKVPASIEIALWGDDSFANKYGAITSVTVGDMTALETQAVANTRRVEAIVDQMQYQWRQLYADDVFLSDSDAWYTLKGQSFAAAIDTQLEVLKMMLAGSKEAFSLEREILNVSYGEMQNGQHCTK